MAHSDGARMQFLRFVLVNIGGLILSNMSIWLFATLLPVIVAKLVAMAVTICFTFAAYRLFVFTRAK